MTEGDGWHRRVQASCRFEGRHQRWDLGADPELVVKALHQVHAGLELPRELREDLVLLVSPGELGDGSRLTVVVAQVLIAREEPDAIATDGPAEVAREVPVPGARVPALRLAAGDSDADRLRGQAGRLPIVRRVVQETVAPLSGHDVENAALDIAVLGGHADRLDLNFLNDVNARLGARHAGAWAREVGAVDQKQVLIAARAERGHRGVCAARWRGRRPAGSGADGIKHAEPPRGDGAEVFGSEARFDAGASRLDSRAGSLHDNRFRNPRQL